MLSADKHVCHMLYTLTLGNDLILKPGPPFELPSMVPVSCPDPKAILVCGNSQAIHHTDSLVYKVIAEICELKQERLLL